MDMRWYPEMEIDPLENLRRLFESSRRRPGEERGRLSRPAWIPQVDAWEDKENFYLKFDLPGVQKEDIEIEVEGDQLTIKGERKLDQKIDYIRRERVAGPFFRAFTLESPIEKEKIKAVYKMGVLEIVLPKKEEAKPKQISITVEE